MSVRVMGWVWQSSRSKGTDRLVLLAIADCAADDGGNAYPSMAALMAKTGLTDRGIQKSMLRLKELDELKIFPNAGPRGCNRYKVVMCTPEPGSPPNDVHPEPRSGVPEPRSPLPPNHVHHPPEPRSPGTVLEPSVEPSENSGARATRGTRLPDDFRVTPEMVDWARKQCPDVDGRLSTEIFLAHWRAESGAKATKRNWEQAWRVWLMRDQANAGRGRHRAGTTGPPSAPERVPTAEQCPDHPGRRRQGCGLCRAANLGKPTDHEGSDP